MTLRKFNLATYVENIFTIRWTKDKGTLHDVFMDFFFQFSDYFQTKNWTLDPERKLNGHKTFVRCL